MTDQWKNLKGERVRATNFNPENFVKIVRQCSNDWCTNPLTTYSHFHSRWLICAECTREDKRVIDRNYHERNRTARNQRKRELYAQRKEECELQIQDKAL